jgi:hypothetical protein
MCESGLEQWSYHMRVVSCKLLEIPVFLGKQNELPPSESDDFCPAQRFSDGEELTTR